MWAVIPMKESDEHLLDQMSVVTDTFLASLIASIIFCFTFSAYLFTNFLSFVRPGVLAWG